MNSWAGLVLDSSKAILIFSALGQVTRLDALRLLAEAGADGLIASDVADALSVPRNTLSAHLKILIQAGLVSAERDGTRITLRANQTQLDQLGTFVSTMGAGQAG